MISDSAMELDNKSKKGSNLLTAKTLFRRDFDQLIKMLGVGFNNGSFNVIALRPGRGKTTFAISKKIFK